MKNIGCLLAALIMSLSCVTAYAVTPNIGVVSDAYVVIEAESGQVLAEKNMNKQKYPASITKILTAAVALEDSPDLSDKITMKADTVRETYPWGNSTLLGLQTGETLTLDAALHATMMLSANDAANALAQYVSGDISEFPELMNAHIKALGLSDTSFTNAHGLPDRKHYTTAYDMAMITRWALTVPGFEEVFGCKTYSLPSTNLKNYYTLANAHDMLTNANYYYEGIVGGKLGWTSDAHHTAVTVAERDGVRLICVALDTTNKWQKYKDTAALFDYCFKNYKKLTLPAGSMADFDVPLHGDGGNEIGTVTVALSQDLTVMVSQDTAITDLKIDYNLPDFFLNGDPINPVCDVYGPDGELLTSLPLEFTTSLAAGISFDMITASSHSPTMKLILRIAEIIGIVILGITCLLFLLRFIIQLHYKRRRARARARYHDYLMKY